MIEIQELRANMCRMDEIAESAICGMTKRRERIDQLCKELPEDTVDQCIVLQCLHLSSIVLAQHEAKKIHLDVEILHDRLNPGGDPADEPIAE